MPYLFVESPHHTVVGRRIDMVVIHTMESAERVGAALACAQWFAGSASEVSAHYCVDSDIVVQCVREDDVAWHARGGNTNSIGIELAGFARQKPAEWNDDYSRAVLARAAELTADICLRHDIPLRRLRPAEIVARHRGLCGHVDVSAAFGKSDHWDPGPGFPWTKFLRLTRESGVVESARKA